MELKQLLKTTFLLIAFLCAAPVQAHHHHHPMWKMMKKMMKHHYEEPAKFLGIKSIFVPIPMPVNVDLKKISFMKW
ncbi:hypothetical protein JTE90_001355 [Oedothorax gibbosus]|uniref:Uncharacterized protein n=1 Tax=Oedothorax gibbosus TaxID=931172 RepID=A0AAV6VH85_9ARAC|nr:hypothetical protein JTE90_001355 [Oedothorax gibbosus]